MASHAIGAGSPKVSSAENQSCSVCGKSELSSVAEPIIANTFTQEGYPSSKETKKKMQMQWTEYWRLSTPPDARGEKKVSSIANRIIPSASSPQDDHFSREGAKVESLAKWKGDKPCVEVIERRIAAMSKRVTPEEFGARLSEIIALLEKATAATTEAPGRDQSKTL